MDGGWIPRTTPPSSWDPVPREVEPLWSLLALGPLPITTLRSVSLCQNNLHSHLLSFSLGSLPSAVEPPQVKFSFCVCACFFACLSACPLQRVTHLSACSQLCSPEPLLWVPHLGPLVPALCLLLLQPLSNILLKHLALLPMAAF